MGKSVLDTADLAAANVILRQQAQITRLRNQQKAYLQAISRSVVMLRDRDETINKLTRALLPGPRRSWFQRLIGQ